jgi:hypothetical protein
MAIMAKTSRRLGIGKHAVIFDGVTQQRSERFAKDSLVWKFINPNGIVEVVSGTNPADGTVCGSMLTLITGVEVGQSGDPDLFIGHEFSCAIEQVADRRTTTITSSSGVSVTTGNGGNGGNGNGGFDAEGQ